MSFQTKRGTVGATVPRVLSSRWHGGCFVSLVLGSDRDETSTPPRQHPRGHHACSMGPRVFVAAA